MALALSVDAAPIQVIIPHRVSEDINHEDYYFGQLLQLALEKSKARYGAAVLAEPPGRQADKRLHAEVASGNIDLFWSPTSPELESVFLPVKVSLLRDLNNYRLLLIRPGTQAQFSKVKNLADLRKFKGGISSQWVDADIMEANDLPLVKAVGYGKLFKMLAAGRFDYFSRGLYQVQTEVNFYPDLHLEIEQDLMLQYRNEVYFFVRRDNKALAERLQFGLEAAQKDGSFDALFNRIPRYQWALAELKKHQRRVIKLLPLEAARKS